MTTCVALLRAVNVGGRNTVAMADLRAWLDTLGMRNPHTVLQSGNVVFATRSHSIATLERTLEDRALHDLRLTTTFMVRTAHEWNELQARNPFPKEATSDPGHLVVMCLKTPPLPDQVATLRRAITGREVIECTGRDLYVIYRDGIGRSRLTTALIERTFGTSATGRNWNTVLRIQRTLELFDSSP